MLERGQWNGAQASIVTYLMLRVFVFGVPVVLHCIRFFSALLRQWWWPYRTDIYSYAVYIPSNIVYINQTPAYGWALHNNVANAEINQHHTTLIHINCILYFNFSIIFSGSCSLCLYMPLFHFVASQPFWKYLMEIYKMAVC